MVAGSHALLLECCLDAKNVVRTIVFSIALARNESVGTRSAGVLNHHRGSGVAQRKVDSNVCSIPLAQ